MRFHRESHFSLNTSGDSLVAFQNKMSPCQAMLLAIMVIFRSSIPDDVTAQSCGFPFITPEMASLAYSHSRRDFDPPDCVSGKDY